MKRHLHILQQAPHEPPGMVETVARQKNVPLRVHRVFQGPIGEISPNNTLGIVLMGGPMSAVDDKAHPTLPRQRELVRMAVEKDLPLLGLCLGAQIIASALGGTVSKAPVGEVGWGSVGLTREGRHCPLFDGWPSWHRTIQWHFDTFTLPKGAVRIAYGRKVPNQALWVGKHVYGLQFHPETDRSIRENWFTPEELKQNYGAFVRETPKVLPGYEKLGNRMIGNFLKLLK